MAWTLFTPEATMFNDEDVQLITQSTDVGNKAFVPYTVDYFFCRR